MKTKLKSMSKRTLSILLVLLMVVSTITVGVLTTTAAYTDKDDNTVGATVNDDSRVGDADLPQDQYINVKLISDHWIKVDGGETGEIDISSYHTDEKIYFDLYGTKYNGGPEVWFNVGGGINATQDQNYTFGTGGSSGNNQNFITVKDKGKIKIKSSYENGSVKLSISSASGSSAGPVETDYYVAGTLNSWAPTEADKMDASGTTYTKTYENVPAGTHELKVKTTIGDSGGTWYGGQNPTSITGTAISKNDYTINDNDNVKFDTNKTANITVTFDGSSKRITSIVANIARKSVASSVALTITPSELKLGNKIRTMTATVTGVDSGLTPIHNITYTFKKADGTVIETVTKKANETTCTISNISSGDGTLFTEKTAYPITVEVSTDETYTDNSVSKAYLPVSDTKTVTFNDGGTYYTSDGAGDDPTWTMLTANALNTIKANVSTLSANQSFTFAISGEEDYVEGYPLYTISQEDNKYCKVTQSTKRISRPTTDDPDAGFTVFTYTVTPLTGIKANTAKLYIDLRVSGGKAANKIYAQADFDKTTGATNTGYAGSDGKKVRYYFAKKADQDKSGSTPIDARAEDMYVTFWNNSVNFGNSWGNSSITDKLGGYAQAKPVGKDGTTYNSVTSATKIYVDTNSLKYDTNPYGNGSVGNSNYNSTTTSENITFNVYAVDLPIWATSACLRNNSDQDIASTKLITLNPNRIYLFYVWDNAVRRSGVPLDEKFWDAFTDNSREDDTYKNEAGEKTFKANAIKYNKAASGDSYWYKVNKELSGKYKTESTASDNPGLYFGMFAEKNNTNWNQWKDWTNWHYMANIAMRWNNVQNNGNNAAEDNKLIGGCPYYASIWDLVGMHLKPVTTTVGGKTVTNYRLQNFKEDQVEPFFDYDWLEGNSNAAELVYEDLDFPFVASKYDGITTYSYDSQVDPNRSIKSGNYTNTHEWKKIGSMLGYSPFEDSNVTGTKAYSFANEFKIEFYLTNTGSLKGTSGNHDIQFNFSGDDDVWVFVDGVLVLDLGGDHMPSSGSINFTDKKVYYKTAADSIKNHSNQIDYCGASDKNDNTTGVSNVKTLDLEMILNSGSLTGEKFNFKDGATKHTLQMFYLERGENESNCSLSFNMPQASGLNIFNEVTAKQVNSGLQAAALLSANTDAFRYNVSTKKVTDTEWNNLKAQYTDLLNIRKTPAAVTTLDALPKFPSAFDAWRTFTQSFTYGTTPVSTTMKGKLSPSGTGTPADSNVLSAIPTAYETLAKTTYELSDNYVETNDHDPIAGRTQELAANGYQPGDFDLLMGQKATFNNKVPANMMVKLYQNKALDEASFNGENNLISCNTRMMNEVYDYYTTTYDIYDNQLQYYVKEADSDATSTENIYASDNSSNDDSFYFTNYSTDSGVINPAMTVSYHNDINVGNLKIQKVLGSNENATSEAEFSFKVYFKDIFGFDEEASDYAYYRQYNEYPIVYHRYSTATNQPVGGTTEDPDPAIPYDTVKGIKLKAGEYALIMGVPVETQFKVVEASVPGFSLSMIKKWAKYPGYENNSSSGDVLYKSRNSFDSAFDNKEIYYQRITVDTKELVVPPTSRTLTDVEIAKNSTIDYTHNIPTNIVQGEEQTDPYPVNSIPIRSQTQHNNEYISTSWVQFTNQKEGIQVSFNYYPRVIVDGQPASISSSPDTYTFTIEDLYEKSGSDYKYIEMAGDVIQKVKYDQMINAALINFEQYNGGVFRNVIDEYQVFKSQQQAETLFGISGDSIVTPALTNPSMTNAQNYKEFTAQNIKYHTNHFSQPIYTNSTVGSAKKSDLWVSYFKDRKELTNANYVDAESDSTSIDDKAAVKKINVWLYNYPKLYEVRYASAQAFDNTTNFNISETYNGYYVCNKLSSNTFTFYYNQRFGEQAVDEEGNPVDEYLYFLGPNEYNYPSFTGQDVVTEPEVTINGTKMKFLYWAFDPYGYSKASDDIRYYYRVSASFNLYPVYGTEEQYNTFKGKPGLSVSLNGDDSFFDVNGRARRRINVLMSPYNCPNDDQNIYSTSVIYVTIGNDVKEICSDGSGGLDEKKVNEFYQQYKAQLETLINGNTVGTSLSPFTYQSKTFELTTKGFKHDVNSTYGTYSPITLTNKNRAQFSTKFTVSPTTSNPDGFKDCFAIAATMYYHNKETGENKWIASDNTVVYDFGKSLINS